MTETTEDQTPSPRPSADSPGSGLVPHSPGPWKAISGTEEDSDSIRWSVVADNGTRPYHIATIENGQPGDCCDTEGSTARLIAAAPELLSLAREMESNWPVWLSVPSDVAFLTRLRAAIAKALGQNGAGCAVGSVKGHE